MRFVKVVDYAKKYADKKTGEMKPSANFYNVFEIGGKEVWICVRPSFPERDYGRLSDFAELVIRNKDVK